MTDVGIPPSVKEVGYLHPDIAGEGSHASQIPGWMEAPDGANEEWQPELEPARIPDYAGLKKHKHYGKYFRPHKYVPFPAIVYHDYPVKLYNHQTKREMSARNETEVQNALQSSAEWYAHPTQKIKIQREHLSVVDGVAAVINSKVDGEALGESWSRLPSAIKVNMTGKSHPVKSETQKLAETVAQALGQGNRGSGIDATAIAAVVAAVMASMGQKPEAPAAAVPAVPAMPVEAKADDTDIQRQALIELAEKEGVKIDKRWGNDRIREALGLGAS